MPLRLESGEELLFGVDTGTAVTSIDKSLEPKLGKRLDTIFLLNFGVMQYAGRYAAPRLYLGNTQLIKTGTVRRARMGVTVQGVTSELAQSLIEDRRRGNTATGRFALHDSTGSINTANGSHALQSNTTGEGNTATGAFALRDNDTGSGNTANGIRALLSNTTGLSNTANGAAALRDNHTGNSNTATGSSALQSNTTGDSNTADGTAALFNNLTGTGNTAVGIGALTSNSIGDSNTATGTFALSQNTLGNFNTAVGNAALGNNTIGAGNIALGAGTGFNVVSANNVIAIGNPAANLSNSCFIGNIYSNIQPQVGIDPDLVTINSSGRLGANAHASSDSAMMIVPEKMSWVSVNRAVSFPMANPCTRTDKTPTYANT